MNVNTVHGACLLRLMTLLVFAWLLPLKAHAFIVGSLSCQVQPYLMEGYTFQAGAEIRIPFSGRCQAVRVFPNGAAVNVQSQFYGVDSPRLQVLDPYSNEYIYELPLGTAGPQCLGGSCARIPVGSWVSYAYYVVGTAPNTPGPRTVRINVGITAVNYPAFAEWVHPLEIRYNVIAASCTLSSPGAVNLSLGTFSSANVGSQSQSTTVSVNCAAATRVNVSLVPTQQVVSASTGVSRTTLAGLNMQALWTDTGNTVTFNNARYMQLTRGVNNVNLSFRPQVVAGQSPAGEFQSQYTLTIDYL